MRACTDSSRSGLRKYPSSGVRWTICAAASPGGLVVWDELMSPDPLAQPTPLPTPNPTKNRDVSAPPDEGGAAGCGARGRWTVVATGPAETSDATSGLAF